MELGLFLQAVSPHSPDMSDLARLSYGLHDLALLGASVMSLPRGETVVAGRAPWEAGSETDLDGGGFRGWRGPLRTLLGGQQGTGVGRGVELWRCLSSGLSQPSGSSGAGMSFQSCPQLGQGGMGCRAPPGPALGCRLPQEVVGAISRPQSPQLGQKAHQYRGTRAPQLVPFSLR